MKTKTTRVAKKRASSISNKEEIKDLFGIDESKYFWAKVEIGMNFLDLHFPQGGEFEKYYLLFRDDPYFWKWWNLKWTNHEAVIIKYFREFPESYDQGEWMREMLSLIDAAEVTDSFNNNYIKKTIANV